MGFLEEVARNAAEEQLEHDRKVRKATVQAMQESLEHEAKMRKLKEEEQVALTEKARIELAVQEKILELVEEKDELESLPVFKN